MLTIERKRVDKLSVVFWTTTIAVDAYMVFLLVTVVVGQFQYMYWLLDAIYSVWFYVVLGVIFIISSSYLIAKITKNLR